MAALGLSSLAAPSQVERTAEESKIDFTQESSELETMARSAQDCYELCLGFHARYLGEKSGGSMTLGSHLKAMRLTAQMIQVYSTMAASNDLSRLTLWEILQHADALPETFNATTEEERLKKQDDNMGAALLKQFNSGGAFGGVPGGGGGDPGGAGAGA